MRWLICVLLLAACAPVDAALTPASPIVRAAIAEAQTTATVEARADITLGLTLTALPPSQTAQAIHAQATALSAVSTGTAQAIQATVESDRATSTAVVIATADVIAAQATARAVADDELLWSQNRALILTQTAGEAEAEAARLQATSWAWYILLIGCAGAIVIIGLALAVRFMGESIAFLGTARAEKIRAEAEAYSAQTLAYAQANANEKRASVFAHGGALVYVNDDGQGSVLYERGPAQLPEPSDATPAQPPMVHSAKGSYPLLDDAGRAELVKFLYRCIRASGGQENHVNTIPSDDKIGMGAEARRRMVWQLEEMGFVRVIPNTGTIITGYPSLLALTRAIQNGAGQLPPTPSIPSEFAEPFPGNGRNGGNGKITLRSGTEGER